MKEDLKELITLARGKLKKYANLEKDIIKIIKKPITTQDVKIKLKKKYELISWNTVNVSLEKLFREKKIKREIVHIGKMNMVLWSKGVEE